MPAQRTSLRHFREAYEEIMDRVKDSIDHVSEREVSGFVELLVKEKSRRILVLGVGRSGLIGRAFAMRLMHLGFSGLLLEDWHSIRTQGPQRQVVRDSSVRIIEGRIDEIGKLQPNAKDYVIDCKRKALIPGLINTHTHLSMSLFRGYADDLELREWLEKRIWPLEARLDGEMCYHGALLGSLEMTRTGTTCFVDMYFHMEDVARATEDAGLRG